MSLTRRIANFLHPSRLNREIDEELESHIAEAVEQGRDSTEARRTFGSPLRYRESSRDLRLIPWLESLRADIVFGWRQLRKRQVTSAAAILSLALGIGACTAAFRLIDALLLRPLPVAGAGHLYSAARQVIDFDGKLVTFDGWPYPSFRQMRAAVQDQAELIAASYAERTDLSFGTSGDMEKAYLQYVSGWMFSTFGLQPTIGRLLTASDDLKPGSHPYAVISYDYWTRHFARDPKAVGRTFRMAGRIYQIVGVAPTPFTGTEPGTVTDIFVSTMMHPGVQRDDWTWLRTLVRLKAGVKEAPVRAILDATSRAFEEQRAKGFSGMSKEFIEKFLSQKVIFQPAMSGASDLQHDFRPALWTLGVLAVLVLVIACANVANLLTAQAAARAREMALRVSIGAGPGRLIQLVLVESGMIAVFAAIAGALFAWWAAPFVVSRINPPDHPVRLLLPADWRALGFGFVLTAIVAVLFGLSPALRASAVNPAGALKGGADPRARRRSMHALIAVQAAFCFLVLFLAGLFAATFDHLSHRPIGFVPAGLLNVETATEQPQRPVIWDQVADHLRSVPGVQSVAIAAWPLLVGASWNGFISVEGEPPGPVLAEFMNVSPGWIRTMKIPLIEGRDFTHTDTTPGVAIVNQSFVRQFLRGRRTLGTSFAKGDQHFKIVGVVRDSPFRDLRTTIPPGAFVPFHSNGQSQFATFVVRTTNANPMALASILRREVPRARPGFRVDNIRTQQELNDSHTVRERLLAMLALFFAAVALLLAAAGLYGVLDYSVLQRRREIGIRIAIGAPGADIARRVTRDIFAMVIAGSAAGLALGLGSMRYIESLLYEVSATAPEALIRPAMVIVSVTLFSALPAVIRAVQIDPAVTLREE